MITTGNEDEERLFAVVKALARVWKGVSSEPLPVVSLPAGLTKMTPVVEGGAPELPVVQINCVALTGLIASF